MFAILSPLLGGMTIAIDSTAGRARARLARAAARQSGAGARRSSLGKWLAAWTFASGVAMLTLAGFVVGRGPVRAEEARRADGRSARRSSLQFVAIIVPFAAMTSALQMLICTYGRSYREAQTYVSYLATVVSFVPVIVLFTGLKEAPLAAAACRCSASRWCSRACCAAMPSALADWAVPAARGRRDRRALPRAVSRACSPTSASSSAARERSHRTGVDVEAPSRPAAALERAVPGFRHRPQQVEFAQRGARGDRVGAAC